MAALRPAARGVWQTVDDLLATCSTENLANTPGELIERFCDIFYHGYLRRAYENPDEREDDIRELATQIGRSGDLKQFLSEVALLTNIDHEFETMDADHPRMHLSTVHQAKGLEWPVVFILWASEGMFPSARAIGESTGDAEERRLFYVAVTRAKDELILCSPSMQRTRDGGVFFCKPSRFIKEIPKNLVRESFGPGNF